MVMLNAVMETTAGVRRLGSAALDLAYVAAGRYEGFWETGLSPWDIAGGIVIVREAGGLVSEIDGRNSVLFGNSIIATNQNLYNPLRKLLMDAVRSENLRLTE
jgi:myo-inositol-1(or 4)-monophosphatase